MNFSQAVKGQARRPGAVRAIQSQAETELGRKLSKEEESLLFSNCHPNIFLGQIQKYGYGFLKFQLFLSQRPELSCEVSPTLTPRDGNCLIQAVADSVLNNDALKHNGTEQLNETWCNLLRELKFFEETDNHVMFLRTRWAVGAAHWMSGGNGSKQNDKELLGYSDEEWNYIWTTMLEDGAWAVPGVKNEFGNIIKENHAPEIFIKYIAHDLKCHIIVFDLVLGQVQFCSANHLKDDNVLFESPLLLYATGGHFQSVFPKDQEFFINYARELEGRNKFTPSLSNPRFEASSGKKIPEGSNLKGLELKNALNQGVSDHKETAKQEQPKCSVKSQANNQSNKKRKPASLKEGPKIEISNRFEWLSSEDESDATHLKRQKSKCDDEVSLAGNRENERARKKALRENHSEEEKNRI